MAEKRNGEGRGMGGGIREGAKGREGLIAKEKEEVGESEGKSLERGCQEKDRWMSAKEFSSHTSNVSPPPHLSSLSLLEEPGWLRAVEEVGKMEEGMGGWI
ncbi:unnamed protein product [Pleuronectes platessa]|uniref:Uncharacterized protein n=1 Tax=Pleuronectes platessa TaxID=8262 RepID=A0A9N7YE90_PLEPL|nr:unnamed protein product [Pleuronectes platessa]